MADQRSTVRIQGAGSTSAGGQPNPGRKRAYGTGSLRIKHGAWYGQWRIGGRLLTRKLGRGRSPGAGEGLTRKQAERELRRLMEEVRVAPTDRRMGVQELGDCHLAHLQALGRKPTTLADYRSILRAHLAPYFGAKAIDRIRSGDFEAYLIRSLDRGLSTKTVSNHLTFAHGMFAFALKRGWIANNPVAGVDLPRASGADPDIRYLDREEVEALIRAIPDDLLGSTDEVLYAVAAMTGFRMGELLALRWKDVDWTAGVVRVRRSITRGRIGTPKSRRSSRAVPMADRVAAGLDGHFGRSRYRADDDLVFPHPETGRPYDPSRLRKRFKAALQAAGLRPIRFHDLRHTFGTSMAAVGVPMRTLQEWMGHRDFKTTLIYADYVPQPAGEREWAERAFGSVDR